MKTKTTNEIMRVVHNSGYVITNRAGHFMEIAKNEHGKPIIDKKTGELKRIPCDDDATYIVWNVWDKDSPKIFVTASYLPTLIKWLDHRKPNETLVNKALDNVKIINQIEKKIKGVA